VLAALAPLTAVRGNNDRGPWAEALPLTAFLQFGGIGIYVLHDIADLQRHPAPAGTRVVVTGHSHKPLVREEGGVLYVNPGSAGPRRFTLPISVGELRIVVAAELDLRALRVETARAALARAQAAAARSGVPALVAEAADAQAVLECPAARLQGAAGEQMLRLDEVAAWFGSGALIVDACRRGLRRGDEDLSLARRPVLFVLVRALGEAWPGDVGREVLIARAFRTRRPDETHRARLRVEIGRLRALAKPFAHIDATARGFVLRPNDGRDVAVLAPPIDGDSAALLALLSDGAAWSTSALALALGASQRTVQRALATLEADARVRAIGQARSRRWLAPSLAGFATILLLPTALPPA
jgi:hypothetical protein